jgi:hypothetical protein
VLVVGVAALVLAATVSSGSGAVTLSDPAITESSGLATSSYDVNFVLTHNDSGGRPEYFVVDARTGATVARVPVPGATNVDWEDIAVSGHTVYLADIGDNAARRGSVTLYAVPERAAARAAAAATTLTYDDGPHDAEALLVPPGGGPRFVVTKRLLGAGVYRIDGSRLVHVADLDTGLVTGGSWSPDGTRIALVSYSGITVYDAAAFPAGVPARLALPPLRQPEGIAWSGNNAVYVDSEGAHTPLDRVAVPAVAPPARTASPTVPSASGSATASAATPRATTPSAATPPAGPETTGGQTNWAGVAVPVGAVVVIFGAIAGARVRRRRHGGLG